MMDAQTDPGAGPELSVTEAAVYHRGLFMHRYGAIEFALGELLTRAKCVGPYRDIDDLKFRFSSKVRAVEDLVALPGPISTYGERLLPLLGELATFEVYRNLLTHGIMVVKQGDPPVIRLRSFEHVKGEGLGSVECTMPFWQLAWLCEALKPLSSGIVPTVAAICREVPLPRVEMDVIKPHPKASPISKHPL